MASSPSPSSTGSATGVLYIAGYGRSGSTLLERVLAQHPAVVGLGEVGMLFEFVDDPGLQCACGALARQCEVWGPRLERLDEVREATPGIESIRRAVERWRVRPSWPSEGGLRDAYRSLIESTLGHESGVRWVVDSSKTTRLTGRRPTAIAELAGREVRMLHLVRDPRGCVASNRRGSNRKLEKDVDAKVAAAGLRTTGSWLVANAVAEAVGTRWPGRYLRVQYESFVAEPARELERIGALLDLDLSEVGAAVERGDPLKTTHQIAGNRIRGKKDLVVDVGPPRRPKLSWPDLSLCTAVDGALASHYGYSVRDWWR